MRKNRKGHGRRRGTVHAQQPCYPLHDRVRRVGPEHFGLLVVDSSKRRFATLLTDFYGHVLLEPTEFENTEPGLTALR